MKIDASSFSLTRIVSFVPFYMLVNRTKNTVFICEEGQDNWTEAQPEQVRAIFIACELYLNAIIIHCHGSK